MHATNTRSATSGNSIVRRGHDWKLPGFEYNRTVDDAKWALLVARSSVASANPVVAAGRCGMKYRMAVATRLKPPPTRRYSSVGLTKARPRSADAGRGPASAGWRLGFDCGILKTPVGTNDPAG